MTKRKRGRPRLVEERTQTPAERQRRCRAKKRGFLELGAKLRAAGELKTVDMTGITTAAEMAAELRPMSDLVRDIEASRKHGGRTLDGKR